MKQEDISKKIADYLRRNPDAGDTLEGVARWWVQCECIEESVEKVAAVLEILVQKGAVKKQDAGDGRPLYKFCKGE
ncbi:MAG: hypothetical protein HZA10_07000 [Nitrospirae bacterium]|nr:hypothetical protein [Nitrospirota bacterium]